MTAKRFRQPDQVPAVRFSEAQFQRWVIDFARLNGWLCYHTRDSRGSEAGFPDIVAIRGDRILFRELKTETGKVSAEQARWIAALEHAGQDVAVWRPSDEKVIEEALRRQTGASVTKTDPREAAIRELLEVAARARDVFEGSA